MKVEDKLTADQFEELLEDARMNAATDWEEEFVADMKEKFEQYKEQMFISDKQLEIIERIATHD